MLTFDEAAKQVFGTIESIEKTYNKDKHGPIDRFYSTEFRKAFAELGAIKDIETNELVLHKIADFAPDFLYNLQKHVVSSLLGGDLSGRREARVIADVMLRFLVIGVAIGASMNKVDPSMLTGLLGEVPTAPKESAKRKTTTPHGRTTRGGLKP